MATGETVRKRTIQTHSELTAQEANIARLVAEGHTNAEIAEELYISPRTVEWHLCRVFTKLRIGTRRQLRRSFPYAASGAITDPHMS
jgi:DNA-binding CsgD family transcriptional regulator